MESRSSALSLQRTGFSVVTRCAGGAALPSLTALHALAINAIFCLCCRSGEVFKADGEVVVNLSSGLSSSSRSSWSEVDCELRVGNGPVQVMPAALEQEGSDVAGAEASQSESAQQLRLLNLAEQRAAAAEAAATAADTALAHALARQCTARQTLADTEEKAMLVENEAQAAQEAALAELPALQQQLVAAEAAEAAANKAVAAYGGQLLLCDRTGEQATSAADNVVNTRDTSGDTTAAAVTPGVTPATPAAVAALVAAQSAARDAAADAEAAWAAVDVAQQQQRKATSRAAAVAAELMRVTATATDEHGHAEAAAAGAAAQQHVLDARAALSASKAEVASCASALRQLSKQLQAAMRATESAERDDAAAQVCGERSQVSVIANARGAVQKSQGGTHCQMHAPKHLVECLESVFKILGCI